MTDDDNSVAGPVDRAPREPERSDAEPEADAALGDLDAAERARIGRRDRDLTAEERKLMNSGSAKWFKQVLDHQAKVAREPRRRR